MTATGWRLKAKASRSQTRASSDNLCEEENDAVLHLGLCHRPLSLSLSLSLSPSKPPKTKRNKKALAKYKALSVESIAPCADLALRPLVGGLQACPFLFIHLFILPLPPEQTSPVLPPKQTKPSLPPEQTSLVLPSPTDEPVFLLPNRPSPVLPTPTLCPALLGCQLTQYPLLERDLPNDRARSVRWSSSFPPAAPAGPRGGWPPVAQRKTSALLPVLCPHPPCALGSCGSGE